MKLLITILVITATCIGCARQVQKPVETLPEPTLKTTYYSHTVRWPGETVSIIAGWYTGDIENWKVLAEANPDIDPNRIFKGIKILIPENMMKTRDPMPKEFVDSFYPKPTIEKTPSETVPPLKEEEEEPPLFGPKK